MGVRSLRWGGLRLGAGRGRAINVPRGGGAAGGGARGDAGQLASPGGVAPPGRRSYIAFRGWLRHPAQQRWASSQDGRRQPRGESKGSDSLCSLLSTRGEGERAKTIIVAALGEVGGVTLFPLRKQPSLHPHRRANSDSRP